MLGDSQHPWVVLTSIFLPLILIIWTSCLLICLYKHMMAKLHKTKVGHTTAAPLRVVVSDNNNNNNNNSSSSSGSGSGSGSGVDKSRTAGDIGVGVISTQYAPVTSHLASSLTMADFVKMKTDINLNDSLGPRYYPSAPISTIPEPPRSNEVFPSPIAPLEPPWPHLPPINSTASEKPSSSPGAR